MLLGLQILLALIVCGETHVRLTFPPARYPDLDFLDNVRTKGPCGVPKTTLNNRTVLEAGSSFFVTWFLAYPHLGGFRLELLDENDNFKQDLTPSKFKFIGASSPGQEYYKLTLDSELECRNCAVRLVREAREWGAEYQFWSCADVDIVKGAVEQCGGQGELKGKHCFCNWGYQGSQCQYKDECWLDRDCGSNGVCKWFQSNSYPTPRVCLCKPGYFGPQCSQSSAIDSKNLNVSNYEMREVGGDGDKIYWRILKEIEEIEFVLQYRSNTWIAVGWKPKGLTECSGPVPGSPSLKKSNVDNEPSAETNIEKETGPEPESEPKLKAEFIQEIDLKTEIDVEPDTKSEPEPKSEAEPETKISENEINAEPKPTAEENGKTMHPMDCADIVGGFAIGDLSRVNDYYTVSRSTPRLDEFFGGSQSLTAAFAFEEDGVTTLMFRKKLRTSEITDHSISEEESTVIWAKGLVTGLYSDHSAMDPKNHNEFYMYDKNVVKYHGVHNRGVFSAELMGTKAPAQEIDPNCAGSYSNPVGCSGSNCTYAATYTVSKGKVTFSVDAKQTVNSWTGIGISLVGKMPDADIILAALNENSEIEVSDRNSKAYKQPSKDVTQNFSDLKTNYANGRLSFTFSRLIDTVADDADLTACNFLLYPYSGGPFNNGQMGYHSSTPEISTQKICFSQCSNA